MFIINERVNQCTPELIQTFMKVEPATLGHILHKGFMDHTIRCLHNEIKVVGPAVTVKAPGADSTAIHKAIELAEKGDVLVIDRCGDLHHACWGGLVTLAATIKGLVGVIIDGLATDVQEIQAMKFPVFCKGLTALTTKLLGYEGEINTVIQCGGVVVRPGDLIVADSNGILVLDPEAAKPLSEQALSMQEKEKQLIARLKAGEPLPEISGANSLILKKQMG